MRKIIPPNFHQQKSSIHISWKFPRLTEISPTADRDLGQAGNIFSYEWIFSVERNNLISTMQAQKNIKEFKMGHEQATSATSTCQKSGKNFRREEKHVEDLINCIISYKTKMTYRDLRFDGDNPRMYKELRESMAKIY